MKAVCWWAGRAGVLSPQASFDATQRIRSITREARDNKRLRERLAFWKDTMRTRGAWSSPLPRQPTCVLSCSCRSSAHHLLLVWWMAELPLGLD